ncbi:glutathione S-transferase [Thraustotheca clavata]|uniref:Glutathione S-transferase n=1 Tax=Thraustotheca clavata TaxID=74557 RepID=A0A1V9Z790_9STRA|nr:glutathione S-transferase [Thraustotheca clavata]
MCKENLVLRYFDIPGRAEVTRLLFIYGGVEFVDKRIPKAMYPCIKSSLQLPFGSLPTLEVQGETFGCALAIARYAAKLVGLYPEDHPLLAFKVDQLANLINDTMVALFMILYMDGCAILRSKRLRRVRRKIPKLLQQLEDEAHDEGTYFSSMTWIDIYLFDLIHNVLLRYYEVLGISFHGYTKLKRIYKNVIRNPDIANYLTHGDGTSAFHRAQRTFSI